jgi:hypothetical protein
MFTYWQSMLGGPQATVSFNLSRLCQSEDKHVEYILRNDANADEGCAI